MDNKFKYVRIQGRNPVANTLTGKGIFAIFMEMIRNNTMEQEDADLYR